jgi:acetyltransferase-like isoleucine patch superfamily enzyme
VNGDVFILKPAHENFDINNFSSMANVYACDSLDDAGNPQGCEIAYDGTNYTKLDPPAALALIDENGHAEIPDTYTSISADAFRESNLKSVTIPNTITSIGEYAFYNTKLTSVFIPASVISIGDYGFYAENCYSSEDANSWGDGQDVYDGCLKLDQVTFADDSMLETIGNNSFSYNNFTSLDLPDSVIHISYSAFSNNYNLVSIDLGESLKIISDYLFINCRNLVTVSLPSTIEEIRYAAFINTSLSSVVIPDSTFDLSSQAFSWNQVGYDEPMLLESVVIGDSLSHIGEYTFANQRNLHTVVIGDAVTWIGDNAFKGAPISSLIMGANVTSIGENAFNAVNGDVFILKPAHENFDINNFSSMANVYACDSLDDAGTPQGCSDAWPDDGIDVPEWPINICDSDSSLPECDPCTLDPESCDPCAFDPASCEEPCTYDSAACDSCVIDPDSCVELPEPINQIIKVTNSPKGILGKTAVLEVSYDTSDSNNQLTGIGMRVHFNSSLLGFKEITNLIEQDIIVSGDGPHNDEDDFDNDPLTDKYISFGWASLFGNWPNVELPTVLMNIAFDVFDNIDTDAIAETNINFSKTAFTVGYEFEAENYNLELKTASWDFDGNGHADALTDGLMMLRYCFGLRGDSVTTSAMAIDSPMNSEQVVAEIESALDMADIDDDGEVRALTDGLILLRYLFDLRGDQLTAATVSLTANRSANEAIEAYIEAYMP